MHITQSSDDRLVITHGSPWLLATFAVLSAALAWGLWFLASRLGFGNEPVAYAVLALGACLWGLTATRLTTFDFDRQRKTLRWRRRGVIPASGEVPFAHIDKATLETRTDRRGTSFYRVVLVLPGNAGLVIAPGRTRDLYRCLEVIERISGVLGHPRMGDLLDAGRTDEAARLAEVRHGVPRDRADAYFFWRERHPETRAADAVKTP